MAITPLHITGNNFYDANNNKIVLRGFNNIGSHYSCLTNQGSYDAVFGGVPADSASLLAMKKWGANCLRITVNAGCWLNCCVSPFTSGVTYQNAILAYIDRANAAGLYTIINLVNTASGTGEMADISAINFWNSIVPMLATRPLCILEPYNEPHTILLWATWRNGGVNPEGLAYTVYGMNQLISAIRTAGSTHVLLIDGMSYAGDFTSFMSNLPTDSLSKYGFSWHRYADWPHTSVTDIGGVFTDAVRTVANNFPGALTEFNGSANAAASTVFNQNYIKSLMTFCDYIGIGYLPWAWCSAGSETSMVSDYVNYVPARTGLVVYERFGQLASGTVDSPRNTRRQVTPTLPY